MRGVIGAAVVMVLLSSCGGDAAGPDNPGGGSSTFSARVDGAAWSAAPQTMSVTAQNIPGSVVIVGGTFGNPAVSLALTLSRIPGTGTFPLGINVQTSTGGIATVARGGNAWNTPLNGAAGSVTITSITADRIVGTFSFEADAVGSVTPAHSTVTAGQFNVPRPAGFTPVTPDQLGSRVSGTLNGASWNAATVVAPTTPNFTASNDAYMMTFIGQIDAPGTYPLSSTVPLRRFSVQRIGSGGGSWGGTAADQGTITVTAISPTRMTGTFSGTLQPGPGTGAPLVITNGSFDVRFGS